MTDPAPPLPDILPLGLGGWLVRFTDRLDDGANRAALAFRAAIEAEAWPGVIETALSLGAVQVVGDPLADPEALRDRLAGLLAARDWAAAPLPAGRRLWTVPAAFGDAAGPDLAEAAGLAGLDPAGAMADLTARPLRVLTLGFAPGMPYLGTLPPRWDLPRQGHLTDRVPAGTLAVAVRQMVLFPAAMPTGWRAVGLTAFRPFRPGTAEPFPLRPGDEIRFRPVPAAEIAALARDPAGGAETEALP